MDTPACDGAHTVATPETPATRESPAAPEPPATRATAGTAAATPAEVAAEPTDRVGWLEIGVAVAAFAVLCIAVLVRAPLLLEPDDYAYRASIVALAQGHLTLTPAEYQALQQLTSGSGGGGGGIAQWVQIASGSWVSEKNPGYPFLALPFQALGLLRLAPLFYGALGCLALFVGARRWFGRWGGTYAVILFVSSGAALVFAWRATMPTFTDASLVAAGAGALVWAMLSTERSVRRRTAVGLLAFVALEAAVFVRYTNVVILGVAVLAVLLTARSARLPWRAPAWWLGSVVLFGAGVLGFDREVYGSALRTGYSSGEITFSLASIGPNLTQMPAHLLRAMPMLLLGIGAIGWIVTRWIGSGREGLAAERRAASRRDAAVGGSLAAGWVAIWGVYAAYDWTVRMGQGLGSSVHVVRFYLPAIGLIALLGAWLLAQLPRWLPSVVLAVVVALGAWSYPQLVDSGLGGPGGGFGGGPGGSPGGGPGGGPGAGPGGGFGGQPGGIAGGPPGGPGGLPGTPLSP